MRSCLPALALLSLAGTGALAQWEPDFRLTVDGSYSYTPYNNARCIAGRPGGVLHVVWYDGRNGGAEIYYKRSTDNGTTWSQDQRLTSDPSQSDYPSIAVVESLLHVVWMENRDGDWEVYYKRSTDCGATWGADVRLTAASGSQWFPCVGAEGENVYVVWDDGRHGGNGEVYFRRSTDGGTTWEDEVRLTTESNASIYPSVSAVDSFVHVIWEDTRTYFDIWYKRSTDCGVTWSPDTRLTQDAGASTFPASWAEGADVYTVFDDTRAGNTEIYFKHSSDNGVTWTEDRRLTDAAGTSMSAAVVSAGDNVHVVWQDARDGGSPEIYYKSSDDKGATWKTDIRLTSDTARSLLPCVAVSDSAVHAVWEDTRDGNLEIYYKRNLSGNVAVEDDVPPRREDPGPASIVRGVLSLPPGVGRGELLDVTGRSVAGLGPAMNDVSRLRPGIYFIRTTRAGQPVRTAKVILTR